MRIVGGKYRGRTLVSFDGDKVRPTGDKVRESLFNILQFKVAGANFLDLCSGTGAIGIEAISRGAKKVAFNDSSRESISILNKNLEKLKIDQPHAVTNMTAQAFLTYAVDKFDIVFIDPPYNSGLIGEILPLTANVLTENGIVVIEDEKSFVGSVDGLIKYDERKYGRVYLTFFKREI